MDNFVVSARKYRPQTFDTVVGQSAITGTLRNAIDKNHLAQAFLFCGPRGVGKTSCARILAREVNAHAAREKGEEISDDYSLNIFELDAASNNSVEDIRQLTDQVRFAPQVGTYKVYIIDEVHMLSQAAFNAFLKTLEEPPAHAIFILATTEKHKILPTILSRCQIFDFQRITVRDIADHLAGIAEKEGVTADPEGLNIIAEKADGAMRDALSMFDQLVSFSGDHLTYESVIENLNVLDYDYYFRIIDHVLAHRIPDSLMVYNEILNKGFDGHNFIIGLAQHLRNLMVCKNANTISLIETSDNIRDKYKQQSEQCSVRFIFKALDALNTADVQYKGSKNQRLLVELTLMRLCAIPSEKKSSNGSGSTTPEVATKKEVTADPEPQKPTPTGNAPSPAPPNVVNEPVSAPEAPEPPEASKARDKTEASISEPDEKPEPEKSPEAPVADDEPEAPAEKPTAQKPDNSDGPSDSPSESDQTSVPPAAAAQRKKVMKKFQRASVSISAGLQESDRSSGTDQSEEPAEDYSNRPRESFTPEALIEAWKTLGQNIRKQRRESLYSTLTARNPELLENFQVKLVISNAAQELELNREKGEMLDFLRETLKNYELDLIFEIETVDQPTGLYTNSQKFEAMVKKNPHLGKLSKNLNLDIF